MKGPGKRVLSFATPSVSSSPDSGEQKGDQLYNVPPSPSYGESIVRNEMLIGQGTPIRYSVPHGSKVRGSYGTKKQVPASPTHASHLNQQNSPMKVSVGSESLLTALKEPQAQNLYLMESKRQQHGSPGGASRGVGVREGYVSRVGVSYAFSMFRLFFAPNISRKSMYHI